MERDGECEKQGARVSAKIHQLVQDLHEKLAKFLCTNFSIILFPKFQTSTMTHRRKRIFKARTAEHWRRGLIIAFGNSCYRNRENILGAE
jgi:hypothetical protein